jgi:hypothetical protein
LEQGVAKTLAVITILTPGFLRLKEWRTRD